MRLTGGRTTREVVRVGDTILRAPSPNAEFVRILLRHLANVDFGGAPRHVGVDERGREIFSYLPGEVPVELGHYDDESLSKAARLIRSYHDATASLFSGPVAQRLGMDVVCHNDLSPCNTVFRDNQPVGFIDFDAAAPGSRTYDLGYAAWFWLDLGNPEHSAVEQMRRLRVFLTAYGLNLRESEIIDAAIERQSILVWQGIGTGNAEMCAWAGSCKDWTLRKMRKNTEVL